MRVTADGEPVKRTKRVTTYQVLVNNEVVEELMDLPTARNRAIELTGRIKVASKTIEY